MSRAALVGVALAAAATFGAGYLASKDADAPSAGAAAAGAVKVSELPAARIELPPARDPARLPEIIVERRESEPAPAPSAPPPQAATPVPVTPPPPSGGGGSGGGPIIEG